MNEIKSLMEVISTEQKQKVVSQLRSNKSPSLSISSKGSSPSISPRLTRSPQLSPHVDQELTVHEKAHKLIDKFIDVADSNNLTLLQLKELFELLQEHEEEHYVYFLDKRDGMSQIHRAICALLTPYSSVVQGDQTYAHY